MVRTMTFDVVGMTCDNCVRHVTEAIQRVFGVHEARVSLARNSAEVEEDFDPAAVAAALDEEGYAATPRS